MCISRISHKKKKKKLSLNVVSIYGIKTVQCIHFLKIISPKGFLYSIHFFVIVFFISYTQ